MNQLPNMTRFLKEDDDTDFTPSAGSNLAAIFGSKQKKDHDMQVPQKRQSTESSAQTRPFPKPEVILAKAVHAYKLSHGHYKSVGKLGIALIGNELAKDFQLILYKGQQNHISFANIVPDFSYTVQPNNYSTYYDKNRDNWSILFENNEACQEFAREVCLSKYFSRKERRDDIEMYQDLIITDKDVIVNDGDKISISYAVSTDIAQPIKMQNTPLQIVIEMSAQNNWEKLLLGMSKNQKKFIIIPPCKQVGLGPGFPKDRDIALEVTLMDILPKEDSLTSQISASPSGTTSILSRIAEMKQSMLPKLPISASTDSDDTEDEVQRKSFPSQRIEPLELPIQKRHSRLNEKLSKLLQHKVQERSNPVDIESDTSTVAHRALISTQHVSSQWPTSQIQPQYVNVNGQLYPMQQHSIAQPITAGLDPTLNIFLSETRTQNAEIRMGMSKIADNVQKLLDKFHDLEMQHALSPTSEKNMENTLKLLLHTKISESKNDDNEFSRNASSSKTLSSEDLSMLNLQLKKTVQTLKDELEQTNESVVNYIQRYKDIEKEKNSIEETNIQLSETIKQLKLSLEDKQNLLEKMTTDLKTNKDLADNYQKQVTDMTRKIAELNSACSSLKNSLSAVNDRESNGNEKSREIKKIMNETYQTLLAAFTENSYSYAPPPIPPLDLDPESEWRS
ncbi:FK506-binding protein 15 [Orussus abietinus]|uniref:FK506-binding protein 15 n=1 Tax=Orussus abietinus TaxID=222816 RepID=UPI000C716002|nr:FK506-binding protein 15 [Orussus abietinus]